jgi:hypothetical protein
MYIKTMGLFIYFSVNTQTPVHKEKFSSSIDSMTYEIIRTKLFIVSALDERLLINAIFPH